MEAQATAAVAVRNPNPLSQLGAWIGDACEAGVLHPAAMVLATTNSEGCPSARTVTLKRLDDRMLTFTTALWTRKAKELREIPHAALLFHWPQLGRQVHVIGEARLAHRAVAEALFAERERDHQIQTLVSRQGEPIVGIGPLRERARELADQRSAGELECPADWGAFHVIPKAVEFWSEAADRLHDRFVYERDGGPWVIKRLAP